MLILFPHNSHKGREINRDRENGRKIHVKSLLCKSLAGDDDELMKSLTNRSTADRDRGLRQTKTEERKKDEES